MQETHDVKMFRIQQIFKDLLDGKPIFRDEDIREWNDDVKSWPLVIGVGNEEDELTGLLLSPNGIHYTPLHAYPAIIHGLIQSYLSMEDQTLWRWEKEAAERDRLAEERSKRNHEIYVKEKRKGYVFLYREKGGDQYQFGRTKQLKQRIKSLNNSVPEGIEVIHVMYSNWMWKLQQEFREYFSYRQNDNGWFLLEESDIKKIVDKKLPSKILSLIEDGGMD